MAVEHPWLWYFGGGAEPECYYGNFLTREEAIAEGRAQYPGETYSILEARKTEFSPPSADSLMAEWLERWGDDDMGRDDYPEFSGPEEAIKAAEADLDRLLSEWFDRHRAIMPTPWAFGDTRNLETFHAPEDDQ